MKNISEDLREIVQLTTLHLLQQFPRKKSFATPIQQTSQPKTVVKPPPEIKPKEEKAVIQSPQPAIKSEPIQSTKINYPSIIELIKKHTPHYSLHTNQAQNLADVIILFEHEILEELSLLKRLKEAIEKQNFTCLLQSVKEFPPEFIVACNFKVIIAASNLLKIHSDYQKSTAKLAIISDLQLFIKEPSKRVVWWQKLLELLQ